MNEPIGCTKCGGNDHNTDECRRFALVPVEPTPAMLDVAVSHALMVSLSGDYNWSAYMRDVWLRMVAAAAPAQGQQVECQECERLRAEVTRLHALVSNYRTAESLLCAELAALKAQQVEQKPVEAVHLGWDYLDDRTKVATYFVPCPGDTPPKLYTEPQPAPAQDVAGWIPVAERLPNCGQAVLAYYLNRQGMGRRIRAEYVTRWTVEAEMFADPDTECIEYSEQEDTYYVTEGWYELIDNWDEYARIAVNEGVVTSWMPLPAAPTHDKQSGGAE